MRCYFSLLLLVMAMGACGAALAQGPAYKVGRTPPPDEIKAWDIDISADGKELPPGSGTAQQGAKIYVQKCTYCHGATGTEGRAPDQMDSMSKAPLVKGGGPQAEQIMRGDALGGIWGWPFAPDIFDYIRRGMPMPLPGAKTWTETLSADQVYALTAWILSQNGIIKDGDVMDAKTLPKVKMPDPYSRASAASGARPGAQK